MKTPTFTPKEIESFVKNDYNNRYTMVSRNDIAHCLNDLWDDTFYLSRMQNNIILEHPSLIY